MNKIDPVEDLAEIRKMMEGSSKFISLSGLSGVFAGLTALVGAGAAWMVIDDFNKRFVHYTFSSSIKEEYQTLNNTLFAIAIGILVGALSFGLLFTYLKARKNKQKLITPVAFRLIRSLMTPLGFGGLFVIGLYYVGAYDLIAPATLIFYGMSLMNASKYVQVELKYLALCEMALGVIAVFALMVDFDIRSTLQIAIWALGFGVLHIIYGLIMWNKYDRK
ncbi:MAG: hypothetical protein ACI857_001425 [Arenicella sp.]|jgi:hypothetical protein